LTWAPKYRGLQNNRQRKSFETKLKTFKRDADKGTTKYFANRQNTRPMLKFMTNQTFGLEMQVSSVTDSTTEPLSSRFTPCRSLE
jgi:hypothetical protein